MMGGGRWDEAQVGKGGTVRGVRDGALWWREGVAWREGAAVLRLTQRIHRLIWLTQSALKNIKQITGTENELGLFFGHLGFSHV